MCDEALKMMTYCSFIGDVCFVHFVPFLSQDKIPVNGEYASLYDQIQINMMFISNDSSSAAIRHF